MSLLRVGPPGMEKPAVLDESGSLRDLSSVVTDIGGETLSPSGLSRTRETDSTGLPEISAGTRIGACVGSIGKFVWIGLNHSDRAAGSGMAIPEEPVVFMKATTSICGPDDTIALPPGSEKSEWELELGVVIGTRARQVDRAEALSHVAGYCAVNDLSEHAYQFERSGQWVKGKSYDRFGPSGPWLVTPDGVPDPQDLCLWLDLNGTRMQDGTTATMIFGVDEVVSHLSEFMTLEPGDIITTGTPPGVGFGLSPPRYLRPGDEMRLGIEGLGEQRQIVEGHA